MRTLRNLFLGVALIAVGGGAALVAVVDPPAPTRAIAVDATLPGLK